jgi:hypothetical protein
MTSDEQANLVLRLVAERDMDGYTLASKSGLNVSDMEAAVRLLVSRGLLRVKGDVTGSRLMDSWFQAAPGALARMFLQQSGSAF